MFIIKYQSGFFQSLACKTVEKYEIKYYIVTTNNIIYSTWFENNFAFMFTIITNCKQI